MEAKSPSHVDQYVGRRLHARRRELKLSQEGLATKLGLTFQQVQKYERGTNRISAGRLYELARALDTSIAYFFHGVDVVDTVATRGLAEDGAEFAAPIDADACDLLIAYRSLPDPAERKEMVRRARKAAEAAPASKKSN